MPAPSDSAARPASSPGPFLENGPRMAPLNGIEIRYSDGATVFEQTHADEIARHWATCLARNPHFFNGKVLVFSEIDVVEGRMTASAQEISYAGFRTFMDVFGVQAGVANLFGDCVVIGSDGGILLGQMGLHTSDPYMVKCAGGTPDEDDIALDGSVDIVASATREMCEELGLDPNEAEIGGDLWVYAAFPFVSIGVPFRFPRPVAELQAQARAFLAAEDNPELMDAIAVTADDLSIIAESPAHTQAIVRHYLKLE